MKTSVDKDGPFEKWAHERGLELATRDGAYLNRFTSEAWEVWQAARSVPL